MTTTPTAPATPSSWAPFSVPLFRTLWFAALFADTGIWTHDMASSWLMTSVTTSALLISLMQGAASLPYLFFAFPAGVLADTFNHRTMLMVAALAIAAISFSMAVFSFFVPVQPWMLLIYVFLIGTGNAFYDPVWKGTVPQLVPSEMQTSAFGLDGVAVNLARAVGPAIAGVLISVFNPSTALAFNAFAFLTLAALLLRWKPSPREARVFSMSEFIGSVQSGLQFARSSQPIIRILTRTAFFLVPGSVMWALLPLIGRQGMGLSAASYGVLVGCVGLGAIIAVSLMQRLSRMLGLEKLLFICGVAFAINLLVLACLPVFALICFTMMLAGGAWILVLANLQSSLLPVAPEWVRGRVVALYSLIFFGSVSSGSLLWGVLAEAFGAQQALVLAASSLILTSIAGLRLPLDK